MLRHCKSLMTNTPTISSHVKAPHDNSYYVTFTVSHILITATAK